MAKGTFSFEDLNKEMKKISVIGDTIDKSTVSEIPEYIDSGNFMLNACLTGSLRKGYPGNRAVEIQGPSGTGKTFLMLNALLRLQKKEYYIYHYDSENAVDRDQVVKFGIDPSKLFYIPCNTVQEFRTSITNLTKTLIDKKRAGIEIPKIAISLDSIGNLATQKEVDDASSGSEKADMSRAKIIKSIFRICLSQMAECGIFFIYSNHIYQTMDMFSQQIGGGGSGREYGASIILNVNKAQLKEGDAKVGIIVTVKSNKNRFAKPNVIKIHIDFRKGMNAYVGLQNLISWDICGIQKGKFLTEKEFSKLKEGEDRDECRKHTYKNDKDKEVTVYFQPSETSRVFCVKHLNDTVKPTELFTARVFTDEVIDVLDEKVVKPMFNYGSSDEEDVDVIFENVEKDEDQPE